MDAWCLTLPTLRQATSRSSPLRSLKRLLRMPLRRLSWRKWFCVSTLTLMNRLTRMLPVFPWLRLVVVAPAGVVNVTSSVAFSRSVLAVLRSKRTNLTLRSPRLRPLSSYRSLCRSKSLRRFKSLSAAVASIPRSRSRTLCTRSKSSLRP